MLIGKIDRYFAVLIKVLLVAVVSPIASASNCIDSETTGDAVECLERKIAVLARENASLRASLEQVLKSISSAPEHQTSPLPNTQDTGVSSSKAAPPKQSKSVYDYTVTLKSAYREHDRVVVNFVFLNTSDSMGEKLKWYRSLSSDKNTIAYDSEGNTYIPYEISLGADNTKKGSVSMVDIPANTPIKGTIVFKEIPSSINTLHAIKMTFTDGSYSNNKEDINFNNVNFSE